MILKSFCWTKVYYSTLLYWKQSNFLTRSERWFYIIFEDKKLLLSFSWFFQGVGGGDVWWFRFSLVDLCEGWMIPKDNLLLCSCFRVEDKIISLTNRYFSLLTNNVGFQKVFLVENIQGIIYACFLVSQKCKEIIS